MKERPILFSAPMVRAILAGEKTQTRRAMKPQLDNGWHFEEPPVFGRITSPHKNKGRFGVFIRRGLDTDFPESDLIPCPYGHPGDRLWVRESWQLHSTATDLATVVYAASSRQSWTEMHRLFPVELASGLKAKPFQEGWRPSIHMPRWVSRILLEIVSVRVEQLQDISETDALAEGVKHCESELDTGGYWYSPEELYSILWTKINGWGERGWNANPWVWVVEFKVVKP